MFHNYVLVIKAQFYVHSMCFIRSQLSNFDLPLDSFDTRVCQWSLHITSKYQACFMTNYWNTESVDGFNTLRPRQNGRHFADDIFKCIFLNENSRISIKISLKFVHKDPINNIPALVQIMACRRPGDNELRSVLFIHGSKFIDMLNTPLQVKCLNMNNKI